jgi:hypothetical protein
VVSKIKEVAMTCYRPGAAALRPWLPDRIHPPAGLRRRLAFWICFM